MANNPDSTRNAGASNQNDGTSFKGFATPGEDTIIQSTSSAVPSPSQTSEERLDAPKSRIESIDEIPGDANPALVETIGAQQGSVSTADLLRTREAAEEQHLRAAEGQIYADQAPNTVPDQFEQHDDGRPNWPNERQEPPLEYMQAPRTNAPYGATGAMGGTGIDSQQLHGRADALADRAGHEAAEVETRSDLAPEGADPDHDFYERREMDRPAPQSEMDMFAPGMSNLPPEDDR